MATAAPKALPRIAIVGAGISGLRAAQLLLEKGYTSLTVFEARDRIGGRIHSVPTVAGQHVDLGPNWVHGTTDNPIVPLARKSGSTLHEFADGAAVYDCSGNRLPDDEAEELQTTVWRWIDDAMEYSKHHEQSIDGRKSLLDYCRERCDETIQRWTSERGWDEAEQRRRKRNLLEMCEMWGSFVGTGVSRQSLRYFWLEEPIEGPNLFVADTYATLIKPLAQPVLDAGILRLNTPITAVHSDAATKTVTLTTPTDQHTFDAVILTVPLGSLKTSQLEFTPPLPARLTTAISSLSYGHLEKLLLTFPEPFWHPTSPCARARSPSSPPPTPTPPCPPSFLFLPALYSTGTPPHLPHPFVTCFSLAHLPAPHAQPTLLFYVYAPLSQWLHTLAPEQQAAFLYPYVARLPRYRAWCQEQCGWTGVVATRWAEDRWAGWGSYTNFQVGVEGGEEGVRALREGWGDARVWFAGEHTAPVLGLGSVSGAYWSGEGVVGRVLAGLEGRQFEEEEWGGEVREMRERTVGKTEGGVEAVGGSLKEQGM